MSALVDCASAVAARTTSVARASWRLISAIDFDISSAALAATSTLSNASPDVLTAPAVWVVVSLEIAESADAVDRIAATLSPTVLSTPSTLSRNQAMASSMAARRASWAPSRAFFCSTLRRSVMSWWVPIQYAPPGIARLTTAMARPSGNSETKLTTFPAAMISMSSATYLSGSIRQAAGSGAQPNDIGESRAGLHDVRRQIVDFQIAVVANDEARLGVEHHDALGHVVERELEQLALVIQPAGRLRPPETKNDSNAGQETNQAHGSGQAPVELRRQTVQNPQHRVRLLIGCSVCLNS